MSAERNIFIAAGLALSCGLRKGEIAQCRWSWWTARHGAPLLDSSASAAPVPLTVKNQSGHLQVVPLDPFWTVLNRAIQSHAWRTAPTDFVLTDPIDLVSRDVSSWLRARGWTSTVKALHSLRDYSASLITMRYGLETAKIWCRHSGIVTTERHYGRFVNPITLSQAKRRLAWVRFAAGTTINS